MKKVLLNLWNSSMFVLGVSTTVAINSFVTMLFDLFTGQFGSFFINLIIAIIAGGASYFIYIGECENDNGK